MSSEKFKFNKLDNIGTADAENDMFLEDCFVDTGTLGVIRDCQDSRCILLGRTGSGKSALIRTLNQRQQQRAISLSPEKLALSHISNSQVFQGLMELGVHFDLFFKMLWRHVLIVEIIKNKHGIDTEGKFQAFWSRIIESPTKSRKRKRALQYMREWGPKFWEESDYRIKEMSGKMENDLKAKIGVHGLNIALNKTSTKEERKEVVARAQDIVNRVQVEELTEMLSVLDGVLTDPQKPYYITIDSLDDKWVADNVRYHLIRALIESAKDFNAQVKYAKVIVSMREDLLRKVLDELRDPGFQREKYESLMLRLRWNRSELETLLDLRINSLVSRRYTKQTVGLRDIFVGKIGPKKEDAISYMLSRTLMRPRDAVLFLNQCIESVEGGAIITGTILLGAETVYSRRRVESLIDEWSNVWPFLSELIEALPSSQQSFGLSYFTSEKCTELWYSVFNKIEKMSNRSPVGIIGRGMHEVSYREADDLARILDEMANGQATHEDVQRVILSILYTTGLCGVRFKKLGRLFSYEHSLPTINESDLANVQLVIDKTFWSYFDISARGK